MLDQWFIKILEQKKKYLEANKWIFFGDKSIGYRDVKKVLKGNFEEDIHGKGSLS